MPVIVRDSSVHFKIVMMCSGKPTCAPPCLSDVLPSLPSNTCNVCLINIVPFSFQTVPMLVWVMMALSHITFQTVPMLVGFSVPFSFALSDNSSVGVVDNVHFLSVL